MSSENAASDALPANPYNPLAWIIGEPRIGAGTWIGAFTVIDGSGSLEIGEKCDISAGVHIYTHSSVAQCLSHDAEPIERVRTVVGDHVHIGANAVILMGCEIGSHSIIGAGAVVKENTVVPEYSLVVGVPARIIPDGARRFEALQP